MYRNSAQNGNERRYNRKSGVSVNMSDWAKTSDWSWRNRTSGPKKAQNIRRNDGETTEKCRKTRVITERHEGTMSYRRDHDGHESEKDRVCSGDRNAKRWQNKTEGKTNGRNTWLEGKTLFPTPRIPGSFPKQAQAKMGKIYFLPELKKSKNIFRFFSRSINKWFALPQS